MEKHGKSRLHLSLLVFFTSLLLTVRLWDFYFNSPHPIDQTVTAHLVLLMGTLFSAALGLFVRELEGRSKRLELMVEKKQHDLSLKLLESTVSDTIASGIYKACHMLHSPMKLGPLLESAIGMVHKIQVADEASIMLLDQDRTLYIAASSGIPKNIAKHVRMKIGERVAGRAAELRREFLLVDGLENYPEFKGIESNPRIRSSIVCPLICQDELVGVLNLNRTVTRANFTIADLMNVSVFADHVAQAIRNTNLRQSLQEKIRDLESANARLRNLEAKLHKD